MAIILWPIQQFLSDNKIRFKFVTGYGLGAVKESDFIGIIELSKINSNSIQWKIIEQPNAIAFVRDKVILVRAE